MLALVATSAQAEWSAPKCQVDPIDDTKTCLTNVHSDSGEKLTYYCRRKPNEDSISRGIWIGAAEGSVIDVGGYDGNLYEHRVRMRGDKEEPFNLWMISDHKGKQMIEKGSLEISFWIVRTMTISNLAVEMPYYSGKRVVYFNLTGNDGFKWGTSSAAFSTDKMCKQ